MEREIRQQPLMWSNLIDQHEEILNVVAAIRAFAPRSIQFIARGTSDHAAIYAKYLAEVLCGLPAGLASPSTMTLYGARPDLSDVLVIGISQSGGSPDLSHAMGVSRECGALTIALTNDPRSAMATAAKHHIDMRAGEELAVAATKSYTAELLNLFLLFDALAGGTGGATAMLPELGEQLINDAGCLPELVDRFQGVERTVVTGRGYSFATAREGALKLMETTYLSAQAFSGADLLHGPIAMIGTGFPVLLVAGDGAGGDAMTTVVERLRELDADLFVIGSQAIVDRTGAGIVVPGHVGEKLSPVLEILPFQLLALNLARAKGIDPDQPRGLLKVTRTL
ncbi:SIS domain-containing protein [Lacisediminihabitans profunda]|uniref:SIS domain-containing protein n=2 Tax=Lacisediminihabitans profunda TaxID=2594790 RepID=A0A5C8UVE7_9MICO|nr:SIS domain-containing protein [Lacisediminihabitans profunda]